MDKKVVRRMTIPASFVLGTFEILGIVAGCTLCFVGFYLEVFIGAMALETFYICYAVYGIEPLLIEFR